MAIPTLFVLVDAIARGASSNVILRGLLGQRSYHADAVLRMAHLHTDMERLDVHVARELCEIVIESANP